MVNVTLLPAILAALTPDGTAIFAGMEEPEESLFRPVLDGHRLQVIDEVRDAGWWSCAVRRT
jgi:ribosomal protein L11 methylase PrmA